MAFLSSINIIGSGLTAQQLRLDVVSENITNSTTTRTENDGGAYRRKMVVFEAQSGREDFRSAMAKAAGKAVANRDNGANAGGVRVTQIVDTVKEITDAMAATQAYSANVTAFNTLKSVIAKGLEIGG